MKVRDKWENENNFHISKVMYDFNYIFFPSLVHSSQHQISRLANKKIMLTEPVSLSFPSSLNDENTKKKDDFL